MSARRAFTLVEMVTALAITGVLLVAMGSAISLVSRSMPRDDDSITTTLATQRAVDAMIAEIGVARTVSFPTPTSIEVVLADMDGDGVDDTIRYAWSGTSGDPIVRTFNAGTGSNIISYVTGFSIIPTRQAFDIEAPGPNAAGAETVLAAYTGAGNQNADIDSGTYQGISQVFGVRAPSDAVSWTLAKARFMLRSTGSTTGRLRASLFTVGTNQGPTGSALASATVNESTLGNTFAWVTFAFAGASGLSPTQAYAITLTDDTSNRSGTVELADTGVLAPGCWLFLRNANNSTTLLPTGSLEFEVYGQIVRPTTTTTQISKVAAIELVVNTKPMGGRPIRSAVRLAAPAEEP